jgi:hypothetical protein
MTDFLILLLLGAEVLVLSRLDRRLFGTWITPFNALAYPYCGVIFLAYLFAKPLDFAPVFAPSVLVWIAGLSLIWISGAFLAWALLDIRIGQRKTYGCSEVIGDQAVATRLASTTALLAIPIMALGVVVALKAAGGWSGIGSADFKAAYSQGLWGHAVVWSTLIGILLIGSYRRNNRLLLVIIIAVTFFIILGHVKGRVLHVIIGGMLLRAIQGRIRLSATKIVLFLASTCVIFALGYVFASIALDPEAMFKMDTYSFLSRHYLYYLFSGPLSFGEALRNGVADIGGDWHSIFAPFIDLYRVTLRAGQVIAIGSLHEKGMIIDSTGVTDNVYTIFGTLYLYLGAGGAAIYVITVGFISYGLLVLAQIRREAWINALYCYLAATLALGFFDFYFWFLDFYELSAVTACLMFATQLLKVREVGLIPHAMANQSASE